METKVFETNPDCVRCFYGTKNNLISCQCSLQVGVDGGGIHPPKSFSRASATARHNRS